MKLAFFQAALLAVVAHAADANIEEQNLANVEGYDFLAQTAAIVDYLFPQESEEQLSQLYDDEDDFAEVESESEAEIMALNEAFADAVANVEAKTGLHAALSSQIKANIMAECGTDSECMEDMIDERTRIQFKGKDHSMTIDMPEDERRNISYDGSGTKLNIDNSGSTEPKCKPAVTPSCPCEKPACPVKKTCCGVNKVMEVSALS